jgi:hypothetical protein
MWSAQQGRCDPDRESGCPGSQDEDEESSTEVADPWIDRASDGDDLGDDSRTENRGDTQAEQPRVTRHGWSLAKLEHSSAEEQRRDQRNSHLIEGGVARHRTPRIANRQPPDMLEETIQDADG